MPRDVIVKDSSIWNNVEEFKAVSVRDTALKIGTVREIQFNLQLDDMRYVVEVSDDNNTLPIVCIPLTRWGGAHNFEEFTLRGYNATNNPVTDLGPPANKPGDTVLVGYLAGDGRQGVILGTIKHPGRSRKLNRSDGIAYVSQFNGLETTIKNDGEWQVTFNGIATNTAKLSAPPTFPVSQAVFDTNIAGSFLKFLNEGSWEVGDARASLPQSIKIDKQAGTTTITSGNVIVKIDKNSESVTTTCKLYQLDAVDKISENTKDAEINATATYTVRSPKIAIGSGGTEVLKTIIDLMEENINLTKDLQELNQHFGNLGAPTILQSGPLAKRKQIEQKIKELQDKLKEIRGEL